MAQAVAIGEAFAQEFYKDFLQDPSSVSKYYGIDSVFSFSVDGETHSGINSQAAIADAYAAMQFPSPRFTLLSMDCQESVDESILVTIIGLFSPDAEEVRLFVQNFVLARSEDTFYVRNDIMRITPQERIFEEEEYVEEQEPAQEAAPVAAPVEPVVEEPAPTPAPAPVVVPQQQPRQPEAPAQAAAPRSPKHKPKVQMQTWAAAVGGSAVVQPKPVSPATSTPQVTPVSSNSPSARSPIQYATVAVRGLTNIDTTTEEKIRKALDNPELIKKVKIASNAAFIDCVSEEAAQQLKAAHPSGIAIDNLKIQLEIVTTRGEDFQRRGNFGGRGRGEFRGRGGRRGEHTQA